MEQYDYRKTEKLEETVYAEIEALSPGQRMQVWESIQDVKRAAEAERLARGRQWFEQAVLPALRGFAGPALRFWRWSGTATGVSPPPYAVRTICGLPRAAAACAWPCLWRRIS